MGVDHILGFLASTMVNFIKNNILFFYHDLYLWCTIGTCGSFTTKKPRRVKKRLTK